MLRSESAEKLIKNGTHSRRNSSARFRDSHRAWRNSRLRPRRLVASRTRTSAKVQEQRKREAKAVKGVPNEILGHWPKERNVETTLRGSGERQRGAQ